MTQGIHYTGNVDGRMVGLLSDCNGKRPLGLLIQELADSLKVEPDRITESVLGIIRKLMERGYIIPAHLLDFCPKKT
jgi:predicted Co/Zn/Cd cation transporter (cation efflux family)